MKCKFLTLIALIACTTATAQIKITQNAKPTARIVLDAVADDNVKQAATLMQDFVKRASGAELPIVTTDKTKKGDIIIATAPLKGLKTDGFSLKTADGKLKIENGGGNGAVYAVVTLLEDYLGIGYYSDEDIVVPKNASITIPELNRTEAPAFRYRQSQSYAAKDPIYKLWYRLQEPAEIFAGGYWVHTFDRLMPSDVYGVTNPEYYSLINGQRRPGKASQWCLANNDVFELVCKQVDSVFKANPGKNIISVSQNDGNYTWCTCPECARIDSINGGPSGSYITFLNKLAARFPDKEFSTLAYLFTMHPPKVVKPLPNVNIMLCDIDCNREVPLTDNASGQDFVKALKGWSAITKNIFVWDYGINFDNMVAPFPNFPILQKNIQLFHNHNVNMHFSQIGGSKGGDFPEMRLFMVSKLMWNPNADTDSLMHSFMNGYYGAAAPYIYEYEKLLEGGLLASNLRLWIYDSPVSHKTGMLNAASRKRLNELFDKAEAVVAGDAELLKRVQRSRLGLQYSELEIARTETGNDVDEIKAKLALFGKRAAEFGCPTLNERNNTPAEYCKQYVTRFLPREDKNIAAGAKIEWIVDPTGRYKEVGETALTDELFGGTTFVESWVGWEGQDGAFVIDMGDVKNFKSITADFLHQLGQWILLPKSVKFSISKDGQTYEEIANNVIPENRSSQVLFVDVAANAAANSAYDARYIKIEVEGQKICPTWHYGVGHPCWFFLDEVTVL